MLFCYWFFRLGTHSNLNKVFYINKATMQVRLVQPVHFYPFTSVEYEGLCYAFIDIIFSLLGKAIACNACDISVLISACGKKEVLIALDGLYDAALYFLGRRQAGIKNQYDERKLERVL
ncbi:hypothetical protein D104_11860 [Marinomonas profundimaris]|uniref:Uncharacterized protein n=1 Tax=Marinomonas profundimaris TaxID=1208321 RepID=W1RYM2_9GAMM|nr:hypothetical protein D104_11860 [Marinomonas profundimaris]